MFGALPPLLSETPAEAGVARDHQFCVAPAAVRRHSVLVPLDAGQAAAAVAATFPDPGLRYEANKVAGTDLWSVGAFDGLNDMPLPGGAFFVGPDMRVWSFSSNPGMHDRGLVIAVLSAIYREGVAGAVEQDALAEAIREATVVRQRQVREIVGQAAAGSLRTRPSRPLP